MAARWARVAGWLGRALAFVGLALAAWYVVLQAAPHPLFAHVVREGRFRLYSDRPITADDRRALRLADERISACEFDDPALMHEVFVCHDSARFVLLAGTNAEVLGITNFFNVSIVRADTARSLGSLIVHERVHALVARRYGVLGRWLIPRWKEEGICEYVSGETGYDVKRGLELLRAGQREEDGGFLYFTYWLAVKHLVEAEGLTLSQVVEAVREEAEVVRAAVAAREP